MSRAYKTYCSVFGCLNNNTSNPELSFFQIPGEHEKRLQWLRLISREDLTDKHPSHRVCEVHFNAQDVLINRKRKLLKKNSLPCLHLPTLSKENKQTQVDVMTVNTSSQTEISYILENTTRIIDSTTVSTSSQTEMTNTLDNITQIAASLTANTPRKRKQKFKLLDCKKRLKEHEIKHEIKQEIKQEIKHE